MIYEKLNRFNTKKICRIHRNSKIIYSASKFGSKCISKVNPTLVFIDAVVSLGELFISYSNYRQIKEQNKQLEIEIKTLSQEFDNLKKSLKLEEKKLIYESEKMIQRIEAELRNNRQKCKALQKAYKHSVNYFLQMKFEIVKYKREFPYSKETKEIEKKYYDVLALYINTTLEVIGGENEKCQEI